MSQHYHAIGKSSFTYKLIHLIPRPTKLENDNMNRDGRRHELSHRYDEVLQHSMRDKD